MVIFSIVGLIVKEELTSMKKFVQHHAYAKPSYEMPLANCQLQFLYILYERAV